MLMNCMLELDKWNSRSTFYGLVALPLKERKQPAINWLLLLLDDRHKLIMVIFVVKLETVGFDLKWSRVSIPLLNNIY